MKAITNDAIVCFQPKLSDLWVIMQNVVKTKSHKPFTYGLLILHSYRLKFLAILFGIIYSISLFTELKLNVSNTS